MQNMQSMFRLPALPWSPGAFDRATVYHQPIVDSLAGGNKGKRKRALDGSSPRSSPKAVTKKVKTAPTSDLTNATTAIPSIPSPLSGGAVQSMLEHQLQNRRGVDGLQQMIAPVSPAVAPMGPFLPPGESQKPAILVPKAHNSGGVFNKTPAIAPAHVPLPNVNIPATNGAQYPAAIPSGVTTLLGRNAQDIHPIAPAVNRQPVPVNVKSDPLVPAPIQSKVSTPISIPIPMKMAEPKVKPMVAPKPAIKIDTDTLRAIVEAEINQAILFKHNELRLIDQEIAKCQIALEQIRRCDLIPTPATQIPSLALTEHSGAALVAPAGYTVPQNAAPWGVIDGPYSRHYAQWLLPSSQFDPQSPDAVAQMALNSPYPRDGRVTRGSNMEVSTPLSAVSSARPSRSATGRVRSVQDPSSPLTSRDPLVLKRQKDGQWVKLYCSNCQPERSDFANVQGFLNHCRISHKLDFKSHEAAAIECGRPVDANEYFPPMTDSAPTSAREPPKMTFSSSFSFGNSAVVEGRPSVHPLNRMTARPIQTSTLAITPRSYLVPAVTPTTPIGPPTPAHSPEFKPAAETPFLSTLLSKRGFASNFGSLVQDAKRKVDLSVYDAESDCEDNASSKQSKPAGKKQHGNNGQFKCKSKNNAAKSASRQAGPGAHRLAPLTAPTSMQFTPPLLSSSSSSSPASAMMTPDVDMHFSSVDYLNPGLVSDRDDDGEEDEEDVRSVNAPSRKDSGDVVIVGMGTSDDGDETMLGAERSFCVNRG